MTPMTSTQMPSGASREDLDDSGEDSMGSADTEGKTVPLHVAGTRPSPRTLEGKYNDFLTQREISLGVGIPALPSRPTPLRTPKPDDQHDEGRNFFPVVKREGEKNRTPTPDDQTDDEHISGDYSSSASVELQEHISARISTACRRKSDHYL